MTRFRWIIFILVVIPLLYASYEAYAAVTLSACSGPCTTKQVGKALVNSLDATGRQDRFEPSTEVSVNEDWWIKLTAQGRTATNAATTTVYPGADIMLMMDTTGSMNSPLASFGQNTTRLAAAKSAAGIFINQSDNRDYLGFGTFSVCADYNNSVRTDWAFEGPDESQGSDLTYAMLHRGVGPLNSQAKDSLIQLIQTLQLGTPPLSPSETAINYCDRAVTLATDVGAAVTVSNTQLGDLFSSAALQNPTSGSTLRRYQTDKQNRKNSGPAYRGSTDGVVHPKYLVLLTDGQENAYPRAYQQEIDAQGYTRVDRARQYGIKIYTVLLGDVNNNQARTLLQNIAADTGGTYFAANSNIELQNVYETIRREITEETEVEISTGAVSVRVEESLSGDFANFFAVPSAPIYGSDVRVYEGIGSSRSLVNCVTVASCGVTNLSEKGFSFAAPFASDKGFEIWFRVSKKNTPLDAQRTVQVDDTSSKVYYAEEGQDLAQANVTLVGVSPYFQTLGGGNIFSHGAISQELPSGQYLFNDNSPRTPGILHRTPSVSVVLNASGPTGFMSSLDQLNFQRVVQVANNPGNVDYDYTYGFYEGAKKTLLSPNGIANMDASERLYAYVLANDATISEQIVFDENNYNSRIVFVNGNLFVNQNVIVSENGRSAGKHGVFFVVKGNIVISPTVSRVDGFYLAEGTISTGNSPTTLKIGGAFYSDGGVLLQRKGDPSSGLAEQFITRPDLMIAALPYVGQLKYVWQEIEP